ncbi:MAG: hypothetical protein KGL53_05735 [Elusimicrobia bacterium]|nr:hypothetical protein [Elusimicrobiota bacterium]
MDVDGQALLRAVGTRRTRRAQRELSRRLPIGALHKAGAACFLAVGVLLLYKGFVLPVP